MSRVLALQCCPPAGTRTFALKSEEGKGIVLRPSKPRITLDTVVVAADSPAARRCASRSRGDDVRLCGDRDSQNRSTYVRSPVLFSVSLFLQPGAPPACDAFVGIILRPSDSSRAKKLAAWPTCCPGPHWGLTVPRRSAKVSLMPRPALSTTAMTKRNERRLGISNSVVALNADRMIKLLQPMSVVFGSPAGQVLMHRTEVPACVLLLLVGMVEETEAGRARESCLAVRGRGSLIGADAAICGMGQSATVSTLTSCVLGRIEVSAFIQRVNNDLEFSREVLLALSIHAHSTTRAASELHSSAFRRTAWILRELMCAAAVPRADGGCALELGLTITQLARMAGTTRETASRAVSRLVKRRLVSRENGTIIAPCGSPFYVDRGQPRYVSSAAADPPSLP